MNEPMTSSRQCGLYGKLPAHGDFIDRNLPVSFITEWDLWLQQSLTASRAQCGEQWLDYYLVSPVWYFALSAGCVDESSWAGIILPSVDAAGRYFPLTLAIRLQQNEYPASFLANHSELYHLLEQNAILALENQLKADDIVQKLKVLPDLQKPQNYRLNRESLHNGLALSAHNNYVWSQLADIGLTMQSEPYSIWFCEHWQDKPPIVLYRKGLPKPDQFSGLLTGQWQTFGWDI